MKFIRKRAPLVGKWRMPINKKLFFSSNAIVDQHDEVFKGQSIINQIKRKELTEITD